VFIMTKDVAVEPVTTPLNWEVAMVLNLPPQCCSVLEGAALTVVGIVIQKVDPVLQIRWIK